MTISMTVPSSFRLQEQQSLQMAGI